MDQSRRDFFVRMANPDAIRKLFHWASRGLSQTLVSRPEPTTADEAGRMLSQMHPKRETKSLLEQLSDLAVPDDGASSKRNAESNG